MHYYEVAPTRIVRANQPTLTYSSESELPIGAIVTIPVGASSCTGLVMSQTTKPTYTVKSILGTLDQPALPPHIVFAATWMSDYYATPLATVLQTILPRGLTKQRRSRHKTSRNTSRERTKNVFTRHQQAATQAIETSPHTTTLLHGVTGSGKTLVYIELAKRALARGQSAIILVPEIALTSQLVDEFSQHFSDILLTHSAQTEAERHLTWLSALHSTQPRVVIGPRSALFLPVPNPGLVAIDECHEPSYKQEQSPRYSALRVASIIMQHASGKLVLGSATPSITDYYLAEKTNSIARMPTPARSGAVKPSVMLVDMTKRSHFSRHQFLSDALLAAITTSLKNGEQSLIFHNRRGSASTTLCESCGWQAGCPRCFIPLTLHTDKHTLTCHICGTNSRVPTSCPECGATDIIHKGIGTKRIEAELAKLFPDVRIARFDADTDAASTVDKSYDALYDGSIRIIIGTQVIAKGLDLPHLRTVGIVQADAGLSLPDYSSSERTFQLLSQAIGRVGRSHHPTKVIVQTYQPAHPAITDALSQNYADFAARTIAQRHKSGFPPYSYLLKLTCTYKTEATAVKNSQALAAQLRTLPGLEVLGPTPAFYERVRDTYRWQIIVRSAKRQLLLDCLAHLPPKNWLYELDPTSLL